MKKALVFFLLIGLGACSESSQLTVQPDPLLGPVQEADGTLSDQAAVDGCGLLLSIKRNASTTDQYAVSDSSLALVKQYLVYSYAVAKLNATVRFQQTGRKKEVLCGFAGFKPFDEVLILSIKPR
ncbi:hypothetical protein GGR92_004591 [Spirosoma lacussanchae]|uniref:hypothetical protein n=1 Tax=Spirosoma lacussanchae TaxID=1884249 RepID=UPI001109938D|nr:hypothetical protein [Spirosoma lacussanchae]